MRRRYLAAIGAALLACVGAPDRPAMAQGTLDIGLSRTDITLGEELPIRVTTSGLPVGAGLVLALDGANNTAGRQEQSGPTGPLTRSPVAADGGTRFTWSQPRVACSRGNRGAWCDVTPGTYVLTARAYDIDDFSTLDPLRTAPRRPELLVEARSRPFVIRPARSTDPAGPNDTAYSGWGNRRDTGRAVGSRGYERRAMTALSEMVGLGQAVSDTDPGARYATYFEPIDADATESRCRGFQARHPFTGRLRLCRERTGGSDFVADTSLAYDDGVPRLDSVADAIFPHISRVAARPDDAEAPTITDWAWRSGNGSENAGTWVLTIRAPGMKPEPEAGTDATAAPGTPAPDRIDPYIAVEVNANGTICFLASREPSGGIDAETVPRSPACSEAPRIPSTPREISR